MFLGHLPPISYKSPALTLFLVLTVSAQLLQVFGTLFLILHSSSTLHSFRWHLKANVYQLLLHLFNGFFPGHLGKLAPERPFWILMKQEMAVTSAGPYAYHLLLLTPDR